VGKCDGWWEKPFRLRRRTAVCVSYHRKVVAPPRRRRTGSGDGDRLQERLLHRTRAGRGRRRGLAYVTTSDSRGPVGERPSWPYTYNARVHIYTYKWIYIYIYIYVYILCRNMAKLSTRKRSCRRFRRRRRQRHDWRSRYASVREKTCAPTYLSASSLLTTTTTTDYYYVRRLTRLRLYYCDDDDDNNNNIIQTNDDNNNIIILLLIKILLNSSCSGSRKIVTVGGD